MDRIKKFIEEAGWPRILIAVFLVILFLVAPFVGVPVDAALSDTLVRFGMNGVLVLAMVPMVQSGCGLNLGLPLGIIAGPARRGHQRGTRRPEAFPACSRPWPSPRPSP